MEVTITGRHVDITEPIRDYANEKAGKLARYFGGLAQVEVVADKHDQRHFKVEMIAHVDGHEHFVASEISEDLYACIDGVADKLERQLTDHKQKVRSHKS